MKKTLEAINDYNTGKRFAAKREFHKEQAKISYEEKVAQVINLQKIDCEFRKNRENRNPAYHRVWIVGKP